MELLEQPQAIILLVFMVIAALKYVLENVKGKNGDEEQQQSFTELYEETRQQIIERQRGETPPQPGSGEQARKEPPQQLSILDFFGPPVGSRSEDADTASPPPPPSAPSGPPPVPKTNPAAAPERETLTAAETAALKRLQAREAGSKHSRRPHRGSGRTPIREILATPSSARDAIVLREILGPPKGAL